MKNLKTNVGSFATAKLQAKRLWRLAALIAVIGFSLAGCGGDDDNGGNGGAETLTYKGKGAASGDIYTLTIKKTAARAFTPIKGDEFELTDGTDKSKGTVDSLNGSNYTLQPSNDGAPTFGATVSGNDLGGLSGTITLTDGRQVTVTETLTPVTPPNTGGGNWKWTAVADSKFGNGTIRAIAYGNNRFVAAQGGPVVSDTDIAYSDDGVTWTAVEDTYIWHAYGIYDIAFGNNRFIAVGSDNRMAYSTDNGVTWTAKEWTWDEQPFGYGGVGGANINAIAYGSSDGRFVAGGSDGKMAYSDDGVTWTAVADSTVWEYQYSGYTFKANIRAIAYGNNRFVAVGDSNMGEDILGKMAYSTDGINWTAVPDSKFGTDSISAIAYGNNRFVAVGYKGKMAYSSDGVTWTAVSNLKFGATYEGQFFAVDINAIAFGNNRFVAGGVNSEYNDAMVYSSDGINWTAVSNLNFGRTYEGQFLEADIRAIAYGNGRFVAGGGYGTMAYADCYMPFTLRFFLYDFRE